MDGFRGVNKRFPNSRACPMRRSLFIERIIIGSRICVPPRGWYYIYNIRARRSSLCALQRPIVIVIITTLLHVIYYNVNGFSHTITNHPFPSHTVPAKVWHTFPYAIYVAKRRRKQKTFRDRLFIHVWIYIGGYMSNCIERKRQEVGKLFHYDYQNFGDDKKKFANQNMKNTTHMVALYAWMLK